jgi:hypothetical protein|tara:strand:+ start:1094 stop:1390 length:297 start_codon:yes stop_codon:yes gene_type:complete
MNELVIMYFCGVYVRDIPNIKSKIICTINKGSAIIELEKQQNIDGLWIKHKLGWSLLQCNKKIKYMIYKSELLQLKKNQELAITINKIMTDIIYEYTA